ncbi:MAG: hypothetical protein LKE39_08450 [Sphaerochaeta sp.]|nr:hypothetical protein [Sphaerochaeta sp.]MCH3920476.1 hypothetical protein [Sphaerochaeta sp.]MCI2045010.1 hypothetical protein [Sphaerochaeta sp.]MCI2076325.1 hypothetical protein [Sphaerochaeta sp.]MCI2096878.1 hypothetical protein [Sphaerochaeta sp.]
MSPDGWKFKDRKSVVVTIVVIVALLSALTWAEYEMRKNAVEKTHREASAAWDQLGSEMDERFTWAENLCRVVDDTARTGDALAAISLYRSDPRTPLVVSKAYNQLDAALTQMQKALFGTDHYREFQPYFEKLGEIETELDTLVADYQGKAEAYNRTITGRGFAPRIAAQRNLTPLELLSVNAALANRP